MRQRDKSGLPGFLAPKIRVTVTPERFHFHYQDREFVFETRIYLDMDGTRILGIGNKPVNEPAVEMPLFPQESSGSTGSSRYLALEKFMAAAIREVMGRSLTLRPVIFFESVDSLEPVLKGYQRVVLTEAALEAGASAVQFDRGSC